MSTLMMFLGSLGIGIATADLHIHVSVGLAMIWASAVTIYEAKK